MGLQVAQCRLERSRVCKCPPATTQRAPNRPKNSSFLAYREDVRTTNGHPPLIHMFAIGMDGRAHDLNRYPRQGRGKYCLFSRQVSLSVSTNTNAIAGP